MNAFQIDSAISNLLKRSPQDTAFHDICGETLFTGFGPKLKSPQNWQESVKYRR